MTSQDVKNALEWLSKEEMGVQKPKLEITGLTKEPIWQALAAITQEYWNLACWSFHDKGHTTVTFPTFTVPQRIFFSYRYCLYQVAKRPVLAECYKQKLAALKGEAARYGPQPIPNSRVRQRTQGERRVQILTGWYSEEEKMSTKVTRGNRTDDTNSVSE